MVSKVERVASLAMGLGQRHLADYGAVRSRHDFTRAPVDGLFDSARLLEDDLPRTA